MSLGYGAVMQLEIEDEKYVLYKYASGNADNENYREAMERLDGVILIEKSCFVEPEMHKKLKKFPSGRKRIIKKLIPVNVECGKYIEEGRIKIENSSGSWKMLQGIDFMALRLIYKLFYEYQINGGIPRKLSIYS